MPTILKTPIHINFLSHGSDYEDEEFFHYILSLIFFIVLVYYTYLLYTHTLFSINMDILMIKSSGQKYF